VRGSDGQLSSAWSGTQSFKVGKLTTRGTPRYFAAKPGGLNGRRVATIGSLGGLTGGETEAIFFYQTDHLGTPLMMTDQTGQVVWEAEYLPFGEPVTINEDVDGDGTNVTNNLRFPGQYLDQETGVNYNFFRSYDPKIGRYTTSDPIGLLGGINTYLYAHANTPSFIDRYGQSAHGQWINGTPKILLGYIGATTLEVIPPSIDKFGYFKFLRIHLFIDGGVQATVKCTDDDTCKSRTVDQVYELAFNSSVDVGPNLYGVGIGLIFGRYAGLSANLVLALAKVAYEANELYNKYGQYALIVTDALLKCGPDFICNHGFPSISRPPQ
jgi:RHS repeat-associated protein